MITYKEYAMNESASKIADRIILLLIHIRDNNINESFELIDNKRVLLFNKIIKSKSIKVIRDFENSFISKLSDKSLDMKKINLSRLSDKEFIEWLDKFMTSYYTVLRMKCLSFSVSLEVTSNFHETELLPNTIKDLIAEFNLFVVGIRSVFDYIPKNDMKIFSGKDIDRLLSKNYDLSDLGNKMVEPVILESNIQELFKEKEK